MTGVHATRDSGTLVLEIDRVGKRNAVDLPMFDRLATELQKANDDAGICAVLLCGAGEGFCAGHDLAAFDGWPQGPSDPVPRFLHALAGLSKPLVVAVQGWAVGIGATCLLHADWVLAAPGARIRFPFVDLDIAPEAASSLLLARTVGGLRARQLLLGGEAVTSEQALAFGLVTELVPPEQLRTAALARAVRLGDKPPQAYARIKAWLVADEGLHARIDEEIDAINAALTARRRSSPP